jgi:hypothetical protein
MVNVYEQKEKFCRHELLALLQAIYPRILRLEYNHHQNGDETVTVIWLTESGERFRIINVTADSLAALARDVLKNI